MYYYLFTFHSFLYFLVQETPLPAVKTMVNVFPETVRLLVVSKPGPVCFSTRVSPSIENTALTGLPSRVVVSNSVPRVNLTSFSPAAVVILKTQSFPELLMSYVSLEPSPRNFWASACLSASTPMAAQNKNQTK